LLSVDSFRFDFSVSPLEEPAVESAWAEVPSGAGVALALVLLRNDGLVLLGGRRRGVGLNSISSPILPL